jgi:hypothetical protein
MALARAGLSSRERSRRRMIFISEKQNSCYDEIKRSETASWAPGGLAKIHGAEGNRRSSP